MAIEFVAGSNVSVSFDDSGDSVACDVGAGDNRLLVAVVMADGTTFANAPTYNGVPMLSALQWSGVTDQDPRTIEIFYLVNPASGSNTLAVTYPTGTPDACMMAAAFTGVLQESPLDDTSEVADDADPFGLVLTPSTIDQLLVVGAGDEACICLKK